MESEYGYCWASTEDGFRCNAAGAKAAEDYGFLFEHCHDHLGELMAAEYPRFFGVQP